MKNYISILFILLSLSVNGQNLKKGYRNLEKGEYGKALDAFKKNLSEDPENVGANFGIAIIYADDQSPFFNILDAWQYIERIEKRTDQLTQDDIEVLSEYFLNTEQRKTSRPVKKKMAIAIEAIESRLIKYIREENNLDAVYELLERYPNFRHYDNVIHIRNQFEFRKYEKQDTRAAYDEFVKKFPDAAQVPKAIKSINKLAFREVKTQNTVAAYSRYINQYPESEFLQAAIKLRNAAAYGDARRVNTLKAYEDFIANYPDALEISDAKAKQKELLYEQARRIKSLQAFNDFIDKYPDGQYFVDIFNLKASELGALFLREHTMTNPSIRWAKSFDNNAQIESGGIISRTPSGGYLLACNTQVHDSAYKDAWIIKLDAEGKMLWNKTVGQAFSDSVTHILTDSKGDIIVLGYTYLSDNSASRMGWMFKLGSDGQKIWNKNLGKINFSSCAIDGLDRVYLGGSTMKDTLGSYYTVTTFNSKARKVNEKVYTGQGTVNDMLVTPQGDIFICGSNWIMLMEAKRYLKWDAAIDTSLCATNCCLASNGDFYLTGYNDAKVFYAKFDAVGKKLWLQDYTKSDSTQLIKDVAVSSDNIMLVLEESGNIGKMKLFSSDGKFLGILKEFYGEAKLESAYSSGTGTIVVLNDGNMIVIKYAGLNPI